jgi:hypothetical protein
MLRGHVAPTAGWGPAIQLTASGTGSRGLTFSFSTESHKLPSGPFFTASDPVLLGLSILRGKLRHPSLKPTIVN